MKTWLKKIEELLGGGPGGAKRVKTFRWLVLVGLLGCALMILNSFDFIRIKDVDPVQQNRASPTGGDTEPAFVSGGAKNNVFRDYEQAYESQLKDILTKIVGVGEVEVMVTLDSTEEITVEKNSKDAQQVTNEKDTNGGSRHITDVNRGGDAVLLQKDGSQAPLVVKTTKPKIRGVVIVARGAENATVKKLISDSVEKGLNVPANRISVVPRKQ